MLMVYQQAFGTGTSIRYKNILAAPVSNKYRYPVRVKRFIVEYCTYALYICFTTLPVRLDDVQHGVRQSAFWDNIQPAQQQPGGRRL